MTGPRPQTPFPDAAGQALTPVAGQVEEVKQQALAGTLRIDLETAKAILKQLAALRSRAEELVKGCADLDSPLRFGDNWVGKIMSARLRTVAVAREGGVTPVLRTFHQVIDDLEATVRFAAGIYETTDLNTVVALQAAAGQFGVQIEEAP